MIADYVPRETSPPHSKALKWALRLFSTFYIFLFPFAFYMAILSSMVSDSPSVTSFMVGITMFIMFFLPLSIPVSVYLMWSNYSRNQAKKALIYAGLPLYTLVVIFLIFGVLDALILQRYPW